MGLKKTEYANLAVGRLNASIWCDSANMNYLAFLFFFFFFFPDSNLNIAKDTPTCSVFFFDLLVQHSGIPYSWAKLIIGWG